MSFSMIRVKILGMFAVGAFYTVATAHAGALRAPDFTVTAGERAGKVEVSARAPEGFHFNLKSPAFLLVGESPERVRPAKLVKDGARFVLSASQAAKFTVTLYLCDDAKSFCEEHRVGGAWNGARLDAAAADAGAGGAAAPSAGQAAPGGDSPALARQRAEAKRLGFILNDPDRALAEARQGKKPLLIDFFGIWCPPCNELDEEVFPSAEFRKASRGFVKLKLDADSEVSWKLKSRYKVGGYPTVILASADGDELRRIVGFRPLKAFVSEVGKAWASRDSSFRVLKARADAGEREAADEVGQIQLERREYEDAIHSLTGTVKRGESLAAAEIGLAEARKAKGGETEKPAALMDALARAIAKFPASPDAIDWRLQLAELKQEGKEDDAAKALRQEAVRLGTELVRAPERLAGYDASAADVWSQIADAQEKLGDKDGARSAWAGAAAEYRKKKPGDRERGYNLELAYCLWKSGEVSDAERLYTTLERSYPDEFTFYYGHASMKFALEKFEEARELGAKALAHSYGDNRLRAAHLLARALKSLGRAGEGKALVEKTLAAAGAPSDESIRTSRYLKSLRELAKKLD